MVASSSRLICLSSFPSTFPLIYSFGHEEPCRHLHNCRFSHHLYFLGHFPRYLWLPFGLCPRNNPQSFVRTDFALSTLMGGSRRRRRRRRKEPLLPSLGGSGGKWKKGGRRKKGRLLFKKKFFPPFSHGSLPSLSSHLRTLLFPLLSPFPSCFLLQRLLPPLPGRRDRPRR